MEMAPVDVPKHAASVTTTLSIATAVAGSVTVKLSTRVQEGTALSLIVTVYVAAARELTFWEVAPLDHENVYGG
jgi:hypothetical protein